MPLTLLEMCSVYLRRGLAAFNLNQCRKEKGNYAMGGNFLDPRVSLMENGTFVCFFVIYYLSFLILFCLYLLLVCFYDSLI